MNITLTLGDFLAIATIATIVVIFARGSQAYFAGPKGLKQAKAAMELHPVAATASH